MEKDNTADDSRKSFVLGDVKVTCDELPDKKEDAIIPPTATDCSKITANTGIPKDGYFDYPLEDGRVTEDTVRYPFKYALLPRGRLRQLQKDAIIATDDCPEMEEVVYQDLIMDEMIHTIAGQSWKQFAENQVEGDFAEAFRRFMFPGSSGTFRIPSSIQKKLIEELKLSAEQSKPQKGKRQRPRTY